MEGNQATGASRIQCKTASFEVIEPANTVGQNWAW
jgi:hypothetical protein